MRHQGIENPPYTHNLMSLADKSKIINSLSEEQLDFLDFIQPLNIEARYPETKNKLLEVLTEEVCKDIYIKTEVFFKWLQIKLLKN